MINDMESIMFTKEQLADKVAELGHRIGCAELGLHNHTHRVLETGDE